MMPMPLRYAAITRRYAIIDSAFSIIRQLLDTP